MSARIGVNHNFFLIFKDTLISETNTLGALDLKISSRPFMKKNIFILTLLLIKFLNFEHYLILIDACFEIIIYALIKFESFFYEQFEDSLGLQSKSLIFKDFKKIFIDKLLIDS